MIHISILSFLPCLLASRYAFFIKLLQTGLKTRVLSAKYTEMLQTSKIVTHASLTWQLNKFISSLIFVRR